jgi:hypothetical protein
MRAAFAKIFLCTGVLTLVMADIPLANGAALASAEVAASATMPATPARKFPAIIVKITSRPAFRDVAQWQQEIADDQALGREIRQQAIPEADWNRIWINWRSRNGSAGVDRTDAKTRSQALDAELEHLDTEINMLQHKIENASMQRSIVGFTDEGQLVQIYANNPMGAAEADALVVGGKYAIVGITENTGNAIHIILEGANPIDVPSASGAAQPQVSNTPKESALPQNDEVSAISSAPANACFDAKELQSCTLSPDGTITAGSAAATLHLLGTEGKDFLITGEIFTGPGDPGYRRLPGTVVFWLRQTDDYHCYDLGTTGLRVKRILLSGQTVSRYAYPIRFKLPDNQWIPVNIDVRTSGINATFADQSGVAPGPLASDGSNVIELRPGARIRNIRVAIEEKQP